MQENFLKNFFNELTASQQGNNNPLGGMATVLSSQQFPTYPSGNPPQGALQVPSASDYDILPPLVTAQRTVDGALNVQVNFLDNSVFNGNGAPDYNVFYQLVLSNDGGFKLIFYVDYDRSELNISSVWTTNCLSFTVSNYPFEDVNIEEIEVFACDIDPETSRGTKTTVKPPVT